MKLDLQSYRPGSKDFKMTTAVESLLSSFDRLSESEQRDAIREILRRTRNLDYESLTDDELTALADATFVELDEREAGK